MGQLPRGNRRLRRHRLEYRQRDRPFHSKPVTIEATDLEGLSNPVLRKAGKDVDLYPFKLSGTIKRQSTIIASDTPDWCGGKGGGTPPKDCGTKSFRGMKAAVDYSFAKPYGWIQARSEGSIDDPFRNCGPGTQGYPHLLSEKAMAPGSPRSSPATSCSTRASARSS